MPYVQIQNSETSGIHFVKEQAEQKATATVFQYITTHVFRDIIKSKFELEKDDAHSHSRMTLDEENALRYVSGYVVSEGTEEN